MSASVYGDGDRRGLRYGLAAVLAFDVAFVNWHHFFEPAPAGGSRYEPAFLLSIHEQPALLAALSLVTLLALAAFVRRARPLASGFVALVSLGLLVESYTAFIGGPRRMFFTTGAVMAGWLLGLVVARAVKADPGRAERLAEGGAAAGLAATYVNAGFQKLINGGLLKPLSLKAHILSHHAIDDSSFVGLVARGSVTHDAIAPLLSVTVVIIQAGAWIYLVGPRARMLWGSLILLFHGGTLFFLHIIYIEATALLLMFSYPWPRIWARRGASRGARVAVDREVLDGPPLPPRVVRGLTIAGVLFVIVAWIVPTPRPPVDYEIGEQHGKVSYCSLGEFTVGERRGLWRVVEIRMYRGEATLTLRRAEGVVLFALSGPDGPAIEGGYAAGRLKLRSPYSELTPAMTEAGRAWVLRTVTAAAGDGDPGALVDRWIREGGEACDEG